MNIAETCVFPRVFLSETLRETVTLEVKREGLI